MSEPLPFQSREGFLLVAAMLGALTGALLAPSASIRGRIVVAITGLSFAIFIGPAVSEYMAVDSVRVAGAISYTCGVLGNLIVISFLAWIQSNNVVDLFLTRLAKRDADKRD